MEYYKDDKNSIYIDPTDEIIQGMNLVEITEEQLDLLNQIYELKKELSNSDFKVLPDYKDRAGLTDVEYQVIIDQRQSWWDEIQSLETQIENLQVVE